MGGVPEPPPDVYRLVVAVQDVELPPRLGTKSLEECEQARKTEAGWSSTRLLGAGQTLPGRRAGGKGRDSSPCLFGLSLEALKEVQDLDLVAASVQLVADCEQAPIRWSRIGTA